MKGKYINGKFQRRRFWKPVAISAGILLLVLVVGLRVWYGNNLRPVSDSNAPVYFTVQSGESKNQIADDLQASHLIRNAKAFETYLRSNEITILQAGTYILKPSLSAQQIAQMMSTGQVAKNLLTILPGKRLDQIQKAFEAAGYPTNEITSAFRPSNYLGHPALNSLPTGAGLEGYLYPDSFQRITSTPATTILTESLDEMAKRLTPDIVNGFAAHGLSVFQGITLASIVYQETDNQLYEPTIAQVFLSRIAQNIALESNVTANYAADLAGVPRSTTIDSPYNTYLHPGLPPGPIGNFASSALKAVAHPSNTDYLYFVADEQTHKVYFAHTQAEHNAQAQQYCPNTCQ